MDDAKAAGLTSKDNWKKYPRNMLFARAISNGQKWYAPDVYNGVTVYTPDEMGANVDGDGNIIDVTPTQTEAMTQAQAEKVTTQKGTLLTALTVEQLGIVIAETHDATISEAAKIILKNKEAK